MTTNLNGSAVSLASESAMTLSQSMDSVNTTPDDEVRTLFVSGLPMDAKPRELYLLFRSYKGYESALLKMTGRQVKHSCGYEGSLLKVTGKNGKSTSPVGFVTFSSRCSAETAKQDLQGVRFDPDLPQTLRLEFAKSNTKVTKPKQQSPQPAGMPHQTTLVHPLTGQEFGAAFFPGVPETWATHPLTTYTDLNQAAAAMHHPALMQQHPALAQIPHLHPQLMAHHPGAVTPTSMPHPHIAASPVLGSPVGNNGTYTPTSMSNNSTPCSTLFVANLGPFCSEQELKELFGSFPGFVRLKMNNKGGSPVAFVEYQDVRFAAEALSRLQGFFLVSSERGGIRIEFAKNKMGEVSRKEEYPPTGLSPVPAQLAFQ